MAVRYVTIRDFIDNVQAQCTCDGFLGGLSTYLEIYKVLYPDLMDYTFPQDALNRLLIQLTTCVVGTDTDLNCYPMGLLTGQLFDIDGNPVSP